MILLLISFVAGLLTVLAPCTLPLLPVIVGGSITRGGVEKKTWTRPFIVVGSLSLSIIIFTFLLKVSTVLISVPQSFWSLISGAILVFFGLTTLFPNFWSSIPFVAKLSRGSNKTLAFGYQKKNIFGDIIMGAALGPVFTTCSPTYFIILAAVLSQSFALGLLYLIVYTLGLSTALLAISYFGQRVLALIGGLSDTQSTFKRLIGIIFVLTGIMLALGYDKVLEKKLIEHGFFDITSIEYKLLKPNI